MGNLIAPTGKTATLLHTINKQAYKNLVEANSEYEYLYNLGDTMGDKEVNKEELKRKAELSLQTLKSLIDNSESFFKKIKAKLNGYKRVELIFQIITALGGSALFVTLVKDFDEEGSKMKSILQYAGAIIATAGSILQVILNKGLGAWSFNRRNRNEDYDVLVQANLRSARLLRELEPKLDVFDSLTDYEEVISIINEGEDLSEKVGIVIADYK